jgi:signal transduction histidine kinase
MTVGLDADFWSARMAYLAKLARSDGLAVVLATRETGFVTYVSHNVGHRAWGDPPFSDVLARVMRDRSSEQLPVRLPLERGSDATAALITPIVWNDQLVGALIAFSVSGAFDGPDGTAVMRVAELIGLELAEANVLWRAQRSQQDLEAKLRLSREMQTIAQTESDAGSMLERATARLADIFGADGVSIMLADQHGELSVRSSIGLSDLARNTKKKVGEGISGTVAATGEAMILAGPVHDRRFVGNDPSIGQSLVAPIRAGARTLGVVNVKHGARGDRYGQAQLESLTQAAGDLAIALITAEVVRGAEDDRRQAIVLYELSRFATMGNDPKSDLESAVQMLGDTLGHPVVGVWVLEPSGAIRLRASRGGTPVGTDAIAAARVDRTMAAALREGRSVAADLGDDPDRPAWAPLGATSFIAAPIGSHGSILGALVLGRSEPYTEGDAAFAATLGEYLSGMVQKSASAGDSQRIAANERRRIAQELHDGLAQDLTGVVLALEGCQRALTRNPTLLAGQLAGVARDARATLADVRQYMTALRQSETGALSLPITLARLIDDTRRQTGLPIELEEVGVERELSASVERALIRIVGEALRNVAQHAGASRARVTLGYDAGGIAVSVEDDGAGFDSDQLLSAAEERGHFGIIGMRERAEGVGGQLVIKSAPGQGTVIRATIPYASGRAVAREDEQTPDPADPADPGDRADSGLIEDVDAPGERSGFLSKLFGR